MFQERQGNRSHPKCWTNEMYLKWQWCKKEKEKQRAESNLSWVWFPAPPGSWRLWETIKLSTRVFLSHSFRWCWHWHHKTRENLKDCRWLWAAVVMVMRGIEVLMFYQSKFQVVRFKREGVRSSPSAPSPSPTSCSWCWCCPTTKSGITPFFSLCEVLWTSDGETGL